MNQLIARIMQDFSLEAYEPIFPRSLDLGTPLSPRAGNLAAVVGDALSQEASALYQVSVDVSAPKTFERETRALREAMGERGLRESYLLTLGREERDIEVPEGVIHELPAWKWCLARS